MSFKDSSFRTCSYAVVTYLVPLYAFRTVLLGKNIIAGNSGHSQIKLLPAVRRVQCAAVCPLPETQTPKKGSCVDRGKLLGGTVSLLPLLWDNSGREEERRSPGREL